MTTRKTFVGGNWKMNLDRAGSVALARDVAGRAGALTEKVDVALFVPFVYIEAVADVLKAEDSGIRLGAQDVYDQPGGAFTGEISTAMLQDLGVTDVLVGHSERRHVIGETNDLLNRKTRAALDAGLNVTLCIGETLDEREASKTNDVNDRQLTAGLADVPASQLDLLTIAYEPVWAIGTGKTATPEDAQDAHAFIRARLASLYSQAQADQIRIQYGGSVKPDNVRLLFGQPDIDGGLIGGAALKAGDFLTIVEAGVK
ncbi:MAG: triose-phosphate isomerase [Phycisphaerales bacterium]|nr:triose-phosphate isomerase [Phycisphaerales bacterium]